MNDYSVSFDASLMEEESQEAVEVVEERPFLSTPFTEYTVTEGLLLVLVLSVAASALVKILKWGFSWLL